MCSTRMCVQEAIDPLWTKAAPEVVCMYNPQITLVSFSHPVGITEAWVVPMQV